MVDSQTDELSWYMYKLWNENHNQGNTSPTLINFGF